MKLVTREIDYAVRALKYLAENGKVKVPVTELVQELGITRPMLRKIMQELARNDAVISYKGNNGGFVLNKKPEDIYLIDLVEVFQGEFSMNECVQHKDICPNRETCLLRGKIEGIESNVKKELESINIESLLDKKGD